MSDRVSSALRWVSITASDTAQLEPVPQGLSVNVAGLVAIEGDDGNSETVQMEAGVVFPVQAHKVLSTGTTATGIVAYYNI